MGGEQPARAFVAFERAQGLKEPATEKHRVSRAAIDIRRAHDFPAFLRIKGRNHGVVVRWAQIRHVRQRDQNRIRLWRNRRHARADGGAHPFRRQRVFNNAQRQPRQRRLARGVAGAQHDDNLIRRRGEQALSRAPQQGRAARIPRQLVLAAHPAARSGREQNGRHKRPA